MYAIRSYYVLKHPAVKLRKLFHITGPYLINTFNFFKISKIECVN